MRDGGLRKDKTYWCLTPPTTKQNGGEKSIEDYQLKESVQVKNTGRYKEGA
jgi:hypothetical protein